MKFQAKVHTPMYDHNDKKYIRLVILTVKVPFRYRRVMCEVRGRPMQSLIKDDEVEVTTDFKGVWNVGGYSGYSWVLLSASCNS